MIAFLNRLIKPVVTAGRFVWDRPLSTSALLEMCRAIRFFLSSGMMLRDAMRSLGEQGSASARPVARSLAKELEAGSTFQAALERQGRKFPTLFLALATVGEETGKLPEVMHDLEKYYELKRQQLSQLRSQALFPALQFIAAVAIIACLILVLDMLPKVYINGKEQAVDALGLGLIGQNGAIKFVAYVFGTIAAAILAFVVIKALLRRRAIVERLLLFIPVVGRCLRDVALTRFSFAMTLMLDSHMSILKIIRLAFSSTDNPAFMSKADAAEAHVRRGNSVLTALKDAGRFPAAYLSAVAIGEESGHLPEVMRNLADFHDERAKKGIAIINRFVGTLVWVVVAGFIIFLIFNVFNNVYVNTVQKNLPKF